MYRPDATPRREHAFGDLYDLFFEHFPTARTERNVFDIQGFAKTLEYSNETIYRALRETNPLRVKVALRIIEASSTIPGAKVLFWDDLAEFVLPHFKEYSRPDGESLDDLLG